MDNAPHWKLETVKLTAARAKGLVFNRKRDRIAFPFVGDPEPFLQAVIAGLTERDFSETTTEIRSVADVYAAKVEGKNYYLKLTMFNVTDGPVVVISFHAPAYPMKTNRGMVKP